MALQSCAHSLDTLMGPLIPVRLFLKQTDIVILAHKGSVMQHAAVQLSSCGLFQSLDRKSAANVPVRKSSIQ